MSDHAIIEVPPHSSADEAEHAGVHDPNLHHSPEEIKREVRVYLIVFVALAALTAVTVGSFYALKSYPVSVAIGVALAIALVKGSLVAGYFMHLLSEKKLIYAVLILTVFFFAVLIWGPWLHHNSPFN
ncbi:MAG TPA: cytochrome C oxidase subunit IV family protein [Thermoanaerobaculia bacterium]